MGKKLIITAGGTSEAIDKVRKITNSSSGKLGTVITNELLNKWNDIDTIYYICSKNSIKPESNKVKIIEINGTLDLKDKIEHLLVNEKIDYFIHSMAVSDYMVNYITNAKLLADAINNNNNILDSIINNPNTITSNKISSNEENLIIVLKPAPKIISLIKTISPKTFLVGFKLLDGVTEKELIKVAKRLRDKNQCDLVVANDLENIRNGHHQAFIIDNNDNYVLAHSKEDIAHKLIKKMQYD